MADSLFSPNQITGITGGLDALSIGGSIFGTLQSTAGAKNVYQSQLAQARLEMQADNVRRQAMEMSARRQQLQTVRNAQQAGAQALSASVSQGAQFGSGAAAGQQQVGAQAAYANLGTSLALQQGEQMFNINSQIDAQKIAEAQAKSQEASGQGLSSLFGSLGKSSQGIGQLMSLLPALAV